VSRCLLISHSSSLRSKRVFSSQIEQEIPAADYLKGKAFGHAPAVQPAPSTTASNFYGKPAASASFYGASSTSKGPGKKFCKSLLVSALSVSMHVTNKYKTSRADSDAS
jgi:hypothetical protein